LRLPYLLSPNYILDGDEAIVGLMAAHAAQGREVPVFFWGQSFGFSLLEVLPAALAFRVFGLHPLLLPMVMCALFLSALPFYAGAFERLSGRVEWAWMLTLALGAQPVWIVWSLKARGGYLTAFLLLGVILWLVTREQVSRKAWAGIGAVAALLVLAQALWLAPALPLLGLSARKTSSGRWGIDWLNPLLALGALVIVAAGVRAAWAPANPFWNPPVFEGFSLARSLHFPSQLFWMFTGFFNLNRFEVPPLPVWLVATLAALGFFACAASLLLRGLRTGRRVPLVTGVAMVATAAPSVVLRTLQPRYLLPSSVMLLVGLAAWIGSRGDRFAGRLRVVACAALVLLGISALEMRHLRLGNHSTRSNVTEELHNLIHTLHAFDVKAVYVQSGLLQWQIMLYSRESIAARFKWPVDRYPVYVQRVDAARAMGKPTALVGHIAGATPLPPSLGNRLVLVGTDYFMILDPSDDLLRARGFKLKSKPAIGANGRLQGPFARTRGDGVPGPGDR
jgi:hypothetical protein